MTTAQEPTPLQLARREAALARVLKFGDPALRARARPVDVVDDAVRAQIGQMRRLLEESLEVGLAATQLGIMNRVVVYRVAEGPIRALVNPVTEWRSAATEVAEEGCLSIPGVWIDVERATHVRVRGLDERGGPLLIEAAMLEARVLQHELDHLDGVLTLDRAGKAARRAALRALRGRG